MVYKLSHEGENFGVIGCGSKDDLAIAGYVLNNYDTVDIVRDSQGKQKYSWDYQTKNNRNAPLIEFQKKVNGTYYIVEAVPDTANKQLRIASLYMSKKDGSTGQMLNISQSEPQLTPKAPNDANTSTASITAPEATVNPIIEAIQYAQQQNSAEQQAAEPPQSVPLTVERAAEITAKLEQQSSTQQTAEMDQIFRPVNRDQSNAENRT